MIMNVVMVEKKQYAKNYWWIDQKQEASQLPRVQVDIFKMINSTNAQNNQFAIIED